MEKWVRNLLPERPEGCSAQKVPDPVSDTQILLERQALHARWLRFTHPTTGEPLEIEAPLADDMTAVLDELRQYRLDV